MNSPYHLGLLCLTHLLVSADGVIDDEEKSALRAIQEREQIPDQLFAEFERLIAGKKERDIFQYGIALLNECSHQEKMQVFVWLYKLSEVNGRVHLKEIRFLLYSIKAANIDFEDVVGQALTTPSLI